MTKYCYITTPIYYVNDKPHIGHAYTSLSADILSRINKLNGVNTKFLTGTDEHGQKVEASAKKFNKTPQQFVDEISKSFIDLTKKLNLINNDFIRTTEQRHKVSVQSLWKKLEEAGYIYLGKYSGWYAIRDEAYYSDSEIQEVDGHKLAPTGAEVVWKEEESYFFTLSKFQDRLLTYYEQNKDFIAPKSRYNEIVSFVKSGLNDLAISRTNFTWGIKVPTNESHVVYVWIDALTNYISALGYPNIESEEFNEYWNNQSVIHIVGKDIIKFHCVYWPAILLALDLPLPKQIFAHGWWLNEGEKISKSLGNVIDPITIIDEFGLDPLRYFLFKEIKFGKDGDYKHNSMLAKNNNELANEYGNLLQRSMSIVKNVFNSTLKSSFITEEQNEYFKNTEDILNTCINEGKNLNFSSYIETAWNIIKYANSYMNDKAPWKMVKENKLEDAQSVLYFVAELVRRVSILLNPIMPSATAMIFKQLNLYSDNDLTFKDFNVKIEDNHKISDISPIFKKV